MNFAGEPSDRWQGDGAEKEFATVPAREPGGDMGIGTDAFAEFGDDVGVEQIPVHERSTSRGVFADPCEIRLLAGVRHGEEQRLEIGEDDRSRGLALQLGGERIEKFPLFAGRESFDGGFDFSERAHAAKIAVRNGDRQAARRALHFVALASKLRRPQVRPA